MQNWRPNQRYIDLIGTEGPLEYESLVYADGIAALVKQLGSEVEVPNRVPAIFSMHVTDAVMIPNQLVYSLERSGPIFRAFVVNEHVVLVQHSLIDAGSSNNLRPASDSLSEHFGADFVPYGERVVSEGAYPVESLDRESECRLGEHCNALGILRFGRNATSRYLDLHELPWEGLRLWSAARRFG